MKHIKYIACRLTQYATLQALQAEQADFQSKYLALGLSPKAPAFSSTPMMGKGVVTMLFSSEPRAITRATFEKTVLGDIGKLAHVRYRHRGCKAHYCLINH